MLCMIYNKNNTFNNGNPPNESAWFVVFIDKDLQVVNYINDLQVVNYINDPAGWTQPRCTLWTFDKLHSKQFCLGTAWWTQKVEPTSLKEINFYMLMWPGYRIDVTMHRLRHLYSSSR